VSRPLRVALLEHDGEGTAEAVHAAMGDAGHDIEAVAIRPAGIPDLPLRLRKIGDAPGRMPGTLVALARGRFDLAHAFTAQDAVVALAWARGSERPVVYTQRAPVTRATVANRRLRLATLRRAVEGCDAVVAPDEETAESLRRWMAVEARVVSRRDAAGHRGLYLDVAGR
jgi:Glycosyltransferase Family 4